MEQQDFGMSRQPHEHFAATSDNAATLVDTPTTAADNAATDRNRFTMTIQAVASLLHEHGINRDARTIQRWCSSGKIDAIIDTANGERWLAAPASVQAVIDDIVAHMERRPTAFTPTSADTSRVAATVTDSAKIEPLAESDTRRDDAEHVDSNATTSSDVVDGVATLKKELEQVKFENLQLKADVKSREKFNEYIKDQFEEMLEQALNRSLRVGQLEAEVAYLQAALPKGETGSEEIGDAVDRNPQTYEPMDPDRAISDSV